MCVYSSFIFALLSHKIKKKQQKPVKICTTKDEVKWNPCEDDEIYVYEKIKILL